MNCVECRPCISAFAEQHDALDHVVIVNNLTVSSMYGAGHMAQANLFALLHYSNVLNAKSSSGLSLQYRLLDILHVSVEPDFANIHLLQSGLDKTAACIDVVVCGLLLHLANTQSV